MITSSQAFNLHIGLELELQILFRNVEFVFNVILFSLVVLVVSYSTGVLLTCEMLKNLPASPHVPFGH